MLDVYIVITFGLLICVSCDDFFIFFFFKQKTAYEMRISDWSSDVCSSDLGWRKSWKYRRKNQRKVCNARQFTLNQDSAGAGLGLRHWGKPINTTALMITNIAKASSLPMVSPANTMPSNTATAGLT